MSVSSAELEDRWSFDDLMMANQVLDALDEAEATAIEQAKAKANG